MNFIVLATTGGEWVAGLGDPTAMGWLTVAAYFLTLVLCLCCAARPLFSSKEDDRATDLRFWLVLAALMFVFGINKQLDLQTLFTATFKNIAQATGLYGIRGLLQLLFILLVAAAGVWFAWAFFRRYRRSARRNRLAVAGIALLAVFVLVRATSFHYMDSLINASVAGLKLNWIIELGSISLIALAAILHLRRHRRQSRWQGQLGAANDAVTDNTHGHGHDASNRQRARSGPRGNQRSRKTGLKPAIGSSSRKGSHRR